MKIEKIKFLFHGFIGQRSRRILAFRRLHYKSVRSFQISGKSTTSSILRR